MHDVMLMDTAFRWYNVSVGSLVILLMLLRTPHWRDLSTSDRFFGLGLFGLVAATVWRSVESLASAHPGGPGLVALSGVFTWLLIACVIPVVKHHRRKKE